MTDEKPIARQTAKLILAATEIQMDAPSDQDKAFLARQLVQTTLPHADPGNVPVWSRTNGHLTLTIQQGFNDDGTPYGHPFGTIPRLIMYWMTTEALRTKNRKLQLGSSLSDFMQELGLNPDTGRGKRGDSVRLKDQMRRLVEARISFTSRVEDENGSGELRRRMEVAENTEFWWDTRNPRQTALWGSHVELSTRFYEAITANPIPVDLRALRAIKRSPLALDLYSLLTYQAFRSSKSGRPMFMTWRQMQTALGTSYADHADLKKSIKHALHKISVVYPTLSIGDREGGLEVLPDSLPAVSQR